MSDRMDDEVPLSGDPVANEARRRYKRCAEWESVARVNFYNDLKFRHADAVNGYQWPAPLKQVRDTQLRPCLTLNITRQHNLQIINAGKMNPLEVQIRAAGNGATAEAATMLNAVVNHIQYRSDAKDAYGLAREFQVDGGIGYWRLITDWESSTSWNQEIRILPIYDPMSVYLDYSSRQKVGSDAKYGFIFDDVPREQFREAYPELTHYLGEAPLGEGSSQSDWDSRNNVRVCEYFRLVHEDDELLHFMQEGRRVTALRSKLHAEIAKKVLAHPHTQSRKTVRPVVEWYLIVGMKVVDKTIWPGSFIPIIPCKGEEVIIDRVLDRKGHTRAMLDSQRMYNYNASGQVEFISLQTKSPWTGAAEAFEDFQQIWASANINNASWLPFNHLDSNGDPIPPQALPRRIDAPAASAGYDSGMQTAFNQMMMVSGQWQNQMGMMGNERTGEAIARRQDQGDVATFHFQDNYESALVWTGKLIVDLIPKVYDTNRVLHILGDNGVDLELTIDPAARLPYFQELAHNGEVAKRVLNPSIGTYEVRSMPGNSLASRREETVQALTLILTQAPALTGVIGDLLLGAMDFKEAQEAAQRLKRMVPPQALGQGPSPNEQQLQMQVQQLQALLGKALDRNAADRLKLVGKDQMRDIDSYKAETDRFKALADAFMLDEGGMKQVLDQLVQDALGTHLKPILDANAEGVEEQAEPNADGASPPPMPGAQKAPDGEWYLADPTRKGKFLRVAPLAQERQPGGVISNA